MNEKQALNYITGNTLSDEDCIAISEFKIKSWKQRIKEEENKIKKLKLCHNVQSAIKN
ncbi:MAG: hypothetical protein WC933_02755 [Candidatus Paceibacterota bacterium]|jgi:hypothetical protein